MSLLVSRSCSSASLSAPSLPHWTRSKTLYIQQKIKIVKEREGKNAVNVGRRRNGSAVDEENIPILVPGSGAVHGNTASSDLDLLLRPRPFQKPENLIAELDVDNVAQVDYDLDEEDELFYRRVIRREREMDDVTENLLERLLDGFHKEEPCKFVEAMLTSQKISLHPDVAIAAFDHWKKKDPIAKLLIGAGDDGDDITDPYVCFRPRSSKKSQKKLRPRAVEDAKAKLYIKACLVRDYLREKQEAAYGILNRSLSEQQLLMKKSVDIQRETREIKNMKQEQNNNDELMQKQPRKRKLSTAGADSKRKNNDDDDSSEGEFNEPIKLRSYRSTPHRAKFDHFRFTESDVEDAADEMAWAEEQARKQ
jgi:hypothetical protein